MPIDHSGNGDAEILDRLRTEFELAFPPYPMPQELFDDRCRCDMTEFERALRVFAGQAWTALTSESIMQFGYDLSHVDVLLPLARLYFVPGLILCAFYSEEVLDRILTPRFWRFTDTESRSRSDIRELLKSHQRQLIADALTQLYDHHARELDHSGKMTLALQVRDVIYQLRVYDQQG